MLALIEYRLERLKRAAEHLQADALVATSPSNIAYLSLGYVSVPQQFLPLAQAYVIYIPETKRTVYVVSCSEIPSVIEHSGSSAEIYCFGEFRFAIGEGEISKKTENLCKSSAPTPEDALILAFNELMIGNACIAMDESRISPGRWEKITGSLKCARIIPGLSIFMEARRIKHLDEIMSLENATVLAEKSLMKTLNDFVPGMSEIDLEKKYRMNMIAEGAIPNFFVATANLRAAYSDTKNTMQQIGIGSHIRFDFGGILDGYAADLARTASVGKPTSKLTRLYDAVKQGMEQAIAAIKPGVSAREIFEIAVSQTRKNGIPSYSRHHCGHGIGLEMYDSPLISPQFDMLLEENMVLCIETPFYELDWGGVQIESTVAVTNLGARYLDKSSRDLLVLA